MATIQFEVPDDMRSVLADYWENERDINGDPDDDGRGCADFMRTRGITPAQFVAVDHLYCRIRDGIIKELQGGA